MRSFLSRLFRMQESLPVERVEEAAHAKQEAAHRAEATEEVLRVREHFIVVNHIAADIGRAYALTARKGGRWTPRPHG